MTVIVTGGAGFIGINYIFYTMRAHPEDRVIVLDKLTYAANPAALESLVGCDRFRFVQ
ncbi:MAG: NAD-dependent epimerase/dehydratase family protein, partial [Oscillospiraceae bacterium]|nr:NAD-dependent epimerase/dehydratase family protein [Oscillospiraceae bacterium]